MISFQVTLVPSSDSASSSELLSVHYTIDFFNIFSSMAHIRKNKLNNEFHGIYSFSRACFSTSQEIPRFLYNIQVIFHVDKSTPLYPITNHRNTLRTFILCFLKIHFNLSMALQSFCWTLATFSVY
jgi:hypothetical protein